VTVTTDFTVETQGLLQQPLSLVRLPSLRERYAETRKCIYSGAMRWAQHFAPGSEHLPQELLGFIQPTEPPNDAGVIVLRRQRSRVTETIGLKPHLHNLP